jgi:acyl carrier protein
MSEVKGKVVSIIIDKLGVEMSEVTENASFANDLGADSLDTVELIMEFEKEFNISIPDEEAEKIATVGNAIDYIQSNQAGSK